MKKVGVVGILLVAVGYFLYSRYGYLVQSFRNMPPASSPIALTNPVFFSPAPSSDPSLAQIKLRDGYAIRYFAKDVPGARSMAKGNGIVYVGTRSAGAVYALEDLNQDGEAEARYVVASGLDSPNGVAYKDGDLYVAENYRIIRFREIDKNYQDSPSYEVVYDQLPKKKGHEWKYLSFGPDGLLYIPIGMPCNICDDEDIYGRIIRIDPDQADSGFEVVATGIRNSVGFDWNPADNTLWFTDNGRDWLGDDAPPDELNLVSRKDLHFGFPYCHGGELLDPEYGKGKNCGDFEKPVLKLGAHVAALGMKFVGQNIYFAEHGSWNRTEPQGYRVGVATVSGNTVSDYRIFAEGWLATDGTVTGRPVDILPYQDKLLVSDDYAGAVYLIYPTR